MPSVDHKQTIETALADFATRPLADAALGLFETLGYASDRRLKLKPATAAGFLAAFDPRREINRDRALLDDWQAVEFLFQLTDAEVQSAGGQQMLVFDSRGAFDGAIIESYVFLAIDLRSPQQRTDKRAGKPYTRSELAGITRAVNRLFTMPAMILFRHGDGVTLSVVRRRLSKRDPSRDVQEKVTLVKDIRCGDPLRAHLDILADLSVRALYDEFYFHNFVGLHRAWEKRLDSYALNQRFYREVADWYFWALGRDDVVLPRSIEAIADRSERDKQRSVFFIRLLTRLIFCWFLQEKRLIPRDLFRKRTVDDLLRDPSPGGNSYYRAFLQNLFFGTLNQEQDKRAWRKEYTTSSRKGNRGATNLWRHRDLLTDPDHFEALLRNRIPFVNGGLFDCLDEVWTTDEKAQRTRRGLAPDDIRLDDFSEEKDNGLCLPNELFLGDERVVDLSDVYDDKRRRREKVRGLIEILNRYKFTVEENTPLEEEIALDPELLGKVFENLLASYNEDTRTTARKALGAFYTPREIVDYMVDESLKAYLRTREPDLPDGLLDGLFAQDGTIPDLPRPQRDRLIAAIGRVKILDPACGSGAFPMGALHRLVDLLQKLDPNNESWKRDRLAEAERYYEMLRQANAGKDELEQCEARIEDIRHSFDTRVHALDFARKLFLIESCLYGVDIQPIACQIAKLRVFIALIVDQNVDPAAPNLGVRPLPNLETKFVAADTLIPIEKPDGQMELLEPVVRPLRRQLEQIRHDHFNARTPARKAKCRSEDERLRGEIADLLRSNGMPAAAAKALAAWNPYDQNHAAPFFDPELMFGLRAGGAPPAGAAPARRQPASLAYTTAASPALEVADGPPAQTGFDIVIGNPPYVRIQTLKQQNPKLVQFYKDHYESAAKGNYDLYVVFVEAGLNLLAHDGQLAYILPHKFFNAQYGEPLRGLIARGRHLSHVVHFGDQQVFPGATNYVCLLFLAKAGSEACRFVEVADFEEWQKTLSGTQGSFPAGSIGRAEWNLTVGVSAPVKVKLESQPRRLAEVAARVFQGLVTGADPVFILESRAGGRLASCATGEEHEIEPNLVHPLCKGAVDIRRYFLEPVTRSILFPYEMEDGNAELISASMLKSRYPKAWSYLLQNRARLEAREGGKWKHERWYAFGRSQNLTEMEQPKVLTPCIADHASFTLDEGGFRYFTGSGGGGGGGYGITLRPEAGLSLRALLAILNSAAADFYLKAVSTKFANGYFAYSRQFIERIPVPKVRPEQLVALEALVDYLLHLNRHFQEPPEAREVRDALMLGYFEQTINGLVYELYFPEELHERRLFTFKYVEEAALPALDSIPESRRLAVLRETFERIYDLNHPVRACLFSLRSLETVRIIEGEL